MNGEHGKIWKEIRQGNTVFSDKLNTHGELLVGLKTDVQYIKESIDKYETRIAYVERRVNIGLGIAVTLSFIIPIGMTLILG